MGCDCWALGTRLRLAGMLTDRTIAQQWDTLHISVLSKARSYGNECQELPEGLLGGGFISGQ